MSNKTQLQTNNTALDALITRVNSAKDIAASLPEAGGSEGGVEYEIVNLTTASNLIPFTLKRVTSTFGMMTTNGQTGLATNVGAHYNLTSMRASYQGSIKSQIVNHLTFESGALNAGVNFLAPYVAVFINDPSEEALYEE